MWIASARELGGGIAKVTHQPYMSNYLDDASRRFDDRANEAVTRPTICPDCGSRAIDTLAKAITADTYWRCVACGMVWNQKQRRK